VLQLGELNTTRKAAYISLDFSGQAARALVAEEVSAAGHHPVPVPVLPALVLAHALGVVVQDAAKKSVIAALFVQMKRGYHSYGPLEQSLNK